MKRFSALLLLMAVAAAGTPAAAQTGHCKITEQVYGVTPTGDLVVQPFCAMPGGAFLPQRTLAAFGSRVPRLFYGDQLSDHTVTMYGLDADGTLRWYRENAATGRLEPGVVVGAAFRDWAKYHHLRSNGGGDLTGVDDAGRLWRWAHTGWRDGADTWAEDGPQLDGPACGSTRPVFAGRNGPERYVGVDNATYVLCGFDGEARVASVLPAGVTDVTMAAGPGVTYALGQADRRLTRMVLDPGSADPVWQLDAVGPVRFTTVFTGRSIVAEPPNTPKYEWQWTWYTDGD
jgi:hypothetical protein